MSPCRPKPKRHVKMTLHFSSLLVKVVPFVALFCIPETTGFSSTYRDIMSNDGKRSNNSNNTNHHLHNPTERHTHHHHHHPHHHAKFNTTHHVGHQHVFTTSSINSDDVDSHYQQDQGHHISTLPDEEDSMLDTYDPVEAYHQLRRHYLTSTSRVDRVHYGIPSSWSEDGDTHSSTRTRHHTHHQNHQQHVVEYGRKTSYPSTNSSSFTNGINGIRTVGSGYSSESARNGGGNHNGNVQQKYGGYGYSNYQSRSESGGAQQQRCYVCLPPNKSSREAKDILSMFEKEDQSKIADCSEFTQQNARYYEFNCPPLFGGCILRIHGLNISRACSKYRLDECKKANSVEFCYCTEPLCNNVKPPPPSIPSSYSSSDDEDDENGFGSGRPPSDSELTAKQQKSNSLSNKKNDDDDASLAKTNAKTGSNNNDIINVGGSIWNNGSDEEGSVPVSSGCSSSIHEFKVFRVVAIITVVILTLSVSLPLIDNFPLLFPILSPPLPSISWHSSSLPPSKDTENSRVTFNFNLSPPNSSVAVRRRTKKTEPGGSSFVRKSCLMVKMEMKRSQENPIIFS